MTEVETTTTAEAAVERARAELSATIHQLKSNLQPSRLVKEVMAGPKDRLAQALIVYGRFASRSPWSGVIIGAAALALAGAVVRRERNR